MIRIWLLTLICDFLTLAAPFRVNAAPPETHGENAVAFAPDGKWLVTGGTDGRLRIRDGITGAVQATLQGHRDGTWVRGVAVSPDGRTIASASDDLSARLWDVERREERHKLLVPVPKSYRDRTLIFDQDNDPNEVGTAAPASPNRTTRHCMLTVAFAPDGRTVATGDSSGFVWLWDAETGALQESWVADTDRVTQLIYSPNGATIATSGTDPEIRLWDVRTQALRQSLPQPGPLGNHIAYTPDGATLAVAQNNFIKLYDPRTGLEKDRFRAGFDQSPVITFTPQADYLASGGEVGISHLYRVQPRPGRDRGFIISRNPDVVSCRAIAVSPDGRWVAQCFSSMTARPTKQNFQLVAIR